MGARKMIIPPYNGFGSIDDTVQNCLSLVPQPPKKDFIKMLENDNKTLRYAASMVPIRPEDKNRRLLIVKVFPILKSLAVSHLPWTSASDTSIIHDGKVSGMSYLSI